MKFLDVIHRDDRTKNGRFIEVRVAGNARELARKGLLRIYKRDLRICAERGIRNCEGITFWDNGEDYSGKTEETTGLSYLGLRRTYEQIYGQNLGLGIEER